MTEGRITGRLKLLALLVAFMFTALTVRLWYLQVLASDKFAAAADENFVRLVETPALRGKILLADTPGVSEAERVLVGNRASLEVLVNEQEMGQDAEAVIARLADLLDMKVKKIRERLDDPKYYDYQPVPVASDVNRKVAFYIAERQADFPGVTTQQAPVRVYPYGKTAAHLLGSTGLITAKDLKEPFYAGYGNSDEVGTGGLEAAYEKWLRGEKGQVKYRVNAAGENLGQIGDAKPATAGDNIVLNMEAGLQQAVEAALSDGINKAQKTFDTGVNRNLAANAGAAVVLDVQTGAVKAMASWPTYDPSVFVGGISEEQLKKLSSKKLGQPIINRAIAGQYPPASTFKPFTMLSVLRDGIANLNSTFNCPTEYSAPGDETTVFENVSSIPQFGLSFNEALTISCDTVFYPFGWDYWLKYKATEDDPKPAEPFQRNLRGFGFGRLPGLDIAGAGEGFVPTAEWKQKAYESDPKFYQYGPLPGDLIQMTIGQGYMLVTPLQLARAYAAIANDGVLCEPQLVSRIESPDGDKVVKAFKPQCAQRLPYTRNQLNYLIDALTNVPRVGTAAYPFTGFPLSRYPIAGKTGTAQVREGESDYSWFASIAPANDPKYVVLAMVERGGFGSVTAAPIVRRIWEYIFGLKQTPMLIPSVNGGTDD